MRRTFPILVAAFAIVVAANAAQALTVEVAPGNSVEVVEPAGFCALDGNKSAAERENLDRMTAVQGNTNKVLAFLAPCADVDTFRRQGSVEFQRWILLLVPLEHGTPKVVPMNRAQVIADVGAALSSDRGIAAMERGMKSASDRAREVLSNNAQIEMQSNLGELARDGNALYLGILLNGRVAGQQHRVAAVVAITPMNGIAVNVNLYRRYADPADFDVLLEEARLYAADMVKRNVAAKSGGGGRDYFDWGKIATNGLLGGLVAAAVVGVVVLWRRIRRPRRPLG